MTDKTSVLIVGGGLAGLHAADLLREQDIAFELWETRDRLGGRILSPPVGDQGAGVVDLGPSWIWPGFQPEIARLVDRLGLRLFPQHIDGAAVFEDVDGRLSRFPSRASEPRSFRVDGGLRAVIDALAATLPAPAITTSTRLLHLERRGDGVLASGERRRGDDAQPVEPIEPVEILAEHVVLALPPRLAARRLTFEPALDPSVIQTWQRVPTWMAGHAKLQVAYDEPLWRHKGFSGQAFSRRGPMAEIHDAGGPDGGPPFSLFGFFALSAMERKAAGRTLVEESIFQLDRLFGPGLLEPRRILFKDWSDDPDTATEDDFAPLTSHPVYGLPAVADPVLDGRVHLASTEISVRNGGYLEGALEGARAAVGRIVAS